MATSQRAFDQVKNILGKLDRNIDAARSRRISDGMDKTPMSLPSAVAPVPAPASAPINGQAAPIPAPSLNPGTAPSTPGRSPFGRATPMRIQRPGNMTGT